jgi:hypothetical protein
MKFAQPGQQNPQRFHTRFPADSKPFGSASRAEHFSVFLLCKQANVNLFYSWPYSGEGVLVASNSTSGIGKYMSMALLLPLSTGIGYAMGYGIDLLFRTTFIRWIFLVLGTISGFLSLLKELDDDAKRG